MNRTSISRGLLIAVLAMQMSCVLCSEDFPDACLQVFNTCAEEKGELLGQSLVDLDVRKSVVRTREAVVGNLVADAFYDTATDLCQRNGIECPDAAVQNGGGIRSQTACGERPLIPTGPLYEGDIKQMLPFNNQLVVVEISGYDLKLALEHSVDELGLPGKAGQSGHFLQVSRLRFEVDCAQAPHSLDSGETRITTLGSRVLDGSLMIRTDSGSATWAAVDTTRPSQENPGTLYHIAMSAFIGAGNDGFLALVIRDENENADPDGDGTYINRIQVNNWGEEALRDENDQTVGDAAAVARYIKKKQKIAPVFSGRIVKQSSCVAGATQ